MTKPLCAWCLNEYSEEPFCCEKMDYENTKIKLAEAREEIESLKKIEQDRYRSASKAFGLVPPMDRKRGKLNQGDESEKN